MNVDYLIQLLGNRLSALYLAKDQAFQAGDLDRINSIDTDISQTQTTLAQLNLLASVTAAAASSDSTPADLLNSAIQSSQTSVQGPSATALINGFDISAYATDSLYEQKIQGILNAMPTFASGADLDVYIQSAAAGSPLTGIMFFAAAQQYSIDMPLLIAIIQNDSDFGTQGVGANTFNPGNVGNTGTATQTYASWADGVSAVAQWLDNHRVVPLVQPMASTTPAAATTSTLVTPVPVVNDTTSTTTTPDTTASTTPVAAPVIAPVATTTPAVSLDTSLSSTTPDTIQPVATTTPDVSTTTPATDATSTDSTN